MEKLTGREIRRRWIAFFESKGHRYLPGVSLIPQGDKSLLWVNAGVTGLKKYFDGSEIPPCRRIVNVQKSIRTNDIENVGHTARHHTFFEMLGNFSIGDYFRKEVIEWAYQILTDPVEGFGMDPNKLYVTYNPADEEAYLCWQKQGIAKDHLIALEGNFWQIGEGPCGPNTEVFYDRGEKYDKEHKGVTLLENEEENDRYIEIWGIVFSQFNAVNGVERKDYKELPSKNIDTGAGLERIACILQETETNFETDLFMPIIHEVEKVSGKKYAPDTYLPFRVIADHSRCLTFALSDGATFSNEGRGYVLRRLIRRAMRYGRKLGLNRPFMYQLLEVTAKEYGDFYPNLLQELPRIKEETKLEEERFLRTLEAGEEMLASLLEKRQSLSGETIFKLYDTYGFPASLTEEIAKEKDIPVDMTGFLSLMEKQKEKARKARSEVESFHRQSADLLAFSTPSEFCYDCLELESTVTGIFKDGVRVSSLNEGEEGDVAFAKTPFYTEMGGQVSDTGTIHNANSKGNVLTMNSAPRGQGLHHVKMVEGSLQEGNKYLLSVDAIRRKSIERHHSATHILHAALSEVLGVHVDQKGSYVGPDYLRFDFSSPKALSLKQLHEIELRVNEIANGNLPQKTEIMTLDEARNSGAEMKFEGKYGDKVRVVSFGEYSKELCGGTHVASTSELLPFEIISEEAIGSGVRRITAICGFKAYLSFAASRSILLAAERKIGVAEEAFTAYFEGLLQMVQEQKKQIKMLEERERSKKVESLKNKVSEKNGISYLFLYEKDLSREELLALGDSLKSNKTDYLFFLVGGETANYPAVALAKGKGILIAKAGELMKDAIQKFGGKGGGKDETAAGAISSVENFKEFSKKWEDKIH